MAAASYFDSGNDPTFQTEESLEAQARMIEEEIVHLQARIRGFSSRVFADDVSKTTTRAEHSSNPRDHIQISGNCHDQNGQDNTLQIQDDWSNGTLEKSFGYSLQNALATLRDPGVVDRKINDLPDGWLLDWTQDGNPFFVDIATNKSTWTHPRQHDAQQYFGTDFIPHLAWKDYLNRYGLGSSTSEMDTPTIGELAIYHSAFDRYRETTIMSRWWRDSHTHSSVQSLCEVCRHINFDALLHTTNAWGETNAIPLGSLRSIAQKTGCAFCRLIIKAVYPASDGDSGDVIKAEELMRCTLVLNQQWTRYSSTIRPLYVQLKFLWQSDSSPENVTVRKFHQILLDEKRPTEQKNNDSRLVRDEIDIGLVKSWLHTCEQSHQYTKTRHNVIYPSFEVPKAESMHTPSLLINQPCTPVSLSDNSLELTLIDVHQQCLVIADTNVRYIALSYVWGGPQPFQNTKTRDRQLYTPGAIAVGDVEIPLTIRDSIRLVSMLGERYLWIDSLCIVQDNSPEKMEQIANMGNIYSRAILTVVAADGTSCHAGLPGVTPGSRTSFQHTEQVDGMLIANEHRDMHNTVDASIWNTRGWTYQERELSKRYLYFTESCVYFSCNQMICKEDSGLRDVSRIGDKGHRTRAENHPVWNNYRRAVKNFTKRTLTFEDDAINAFEGIISLLQPAFKCDFLYGLPETELDLALLWQPASGVRRRVSRTTGEAVFPSWSWAGWVGEIDYVWSSHTTDDLSRVEWQVQDTGNEDYITSDQLRAPKDGHHGHWESIRPADSVKEKTPYYYEPEYPDIWCPHPTAAKDARRSLTLVRPTTHELRFKAMTAMLHIVAKPHTIEFDDFDELSSCSPRQHTRCPVEVLSADGFVGGTVYVPAHSMEGLASEPREFVRLSRRRGHFMEQGSNVYNRYEATGTFPQFEDDSKEAYKGPTLYPGQRRTQKAWDRYDHSRFNANKPWPLYNVMMIERCGDVAYRVAIGIVHVAAFMQADPVERLVVLA